MKIKRIEFLIQKGPFSQSPEIKNILEEIKNAVLLVSWPEGSNIFTIYPETNANGVVPIKEIFLRHLAQNNWILEHRMAIASRLMPGKVDALKALSDKRFFAVEWETGNISSSHRALNKMAIGLLDGILAGGILVLPSRELYQYLTDRIGNFAEIAPYFPVWRHLQLNEGVLAVIEIEHDETSFDVPPIKKGTNGRALR